jgi:hypothetical protein
MSTAQQPRDVSTIRPTERRRVGRENHWMTARTFADVIASLMVLPAFALIFDAFPLRSPALFLTGLFFLIGFGVSYYVLLRWFLETDTSSRPPVTRQFSPVELKEHQVASRRT